MTEQEMKEALFALLQQFPWKRSPDAPGWWIFQDRDGVSKPVHVTDPESEKDDPETVWIRLPIEMLDLDPRGVVTLEEALKITACPKCGRQMTGYLDMDGPR